MSYGGNMKTRLNKIIFILVAICAVTFKFAHAETDAEKKVEIQEEKSAVVSGETSAAAAGTVFMDEEPTDDSTGDDSSDDDMGSEE
jgi:uncharacterized protein YxeA